LVSRKKSILTINLRKCSHNNKSKVDVGKVRKYCLRKKETTESLPFDETTLVFKVSGKMFCLLNLNPPFSINLKCEPEKALELREKYDGVLPGYHMNKKHWNTVMLDSGIPEREIKKWIDISYELVVAKLPKNLRESLR